MSQQQSRSLEHSLILRMFQDNLSLASQFAGVHNHAAARQHMRAALLTLEQIEALPSWPDTLLESEPLTAPVTIECPAQAEPVNTP